MPRTPCTTFQRHLGEPAWVRRFAERGAPGAYLRVVGAGVVRGGDAVRVLDRPSHGVTIGEVSAARGGDAPRLQLLLDAQPDLAPALVAALSRRLRRVPV